MRRLHLFPLIFLAPDAPGGAGAAGGASGGGASGGAGGSAGAGAVGAGAGGAASAEGAASPASQTSTQPITPADGAKVDPKAAPADPKATPADAPFDWSSADWSSVGMENIPEAHRDHVYGLFKDRIKEQINEALMRETGPLQIELGWLRGDESQFDKLPQVAELRKQIDDAKKAGELSAKEAADLKKQIEALTAENNGFKEYINRQAEEANNATKQKHPRLFSDKDSDKPLRDAFIEMIDQDFDVDLAADIAVLGTKTVKALRAYMKEHRIRPDQEGLIRQFLSSRRGEEETSLVGAGGGGRADSPKSYNEMLEELNGMRIS